MSHYWLLDRKPTLQQCTLWSRSKCQCDASISLQKAWSCNLRTNINVPTTSGSIGSTPVGHRREHSSQDQRFPGASRLRSTGHESWLKSVHHPWKAISEHCQCPHWCRERRNQVQHKRSRRTLHIQTQTRERLYSEGSSWRTTGDTISGGRKLRRLKDLEVQLGGPKNPKPSPGGKSVFIRIINFLIFKFLHN